MFLFTKETIVLQNWMHSRLIELKGIKICLSYLKYVINTIIIDTPVYRQLMAL